MGDVLGLDKNQSDSENLGSFINAVLSQSENSLERRKALNKLLSKLSKHPKLLQSNHLDYNIALNETLLWVAKNIEKFNFLPDTEVSIDEQFVRWVNSYFRYRLLDLKISSNVYGMKYKNNYFTVVPDFMVLQIPNNEGYHNGIDNFIEQEELRQKEELVDRLMQYIEQDPDNILRSNHLRNRPDCNCQVITQSRLLKNPPDTWSEISNNLQVNFSTLISFWNRKCLSHLQEIAVKISQPDYSLEKRRQITSKSDSEENNSLSDQDKIREVIKLLAEDKREIIELRLAGKNWSEIASHFQNKGEAVSVSTMRKRGQRAIDELKKLLLIQFGSSEISL